MRINRRQLRRLIESVINEEMKGEFMSKEDSQDLYRKSLSTKRSFEASGREGVPASQFGGNVYFDEMSGVYFVESNESDLGYKIIPGNHPPEFEPLDNFREQARNEMFDKCLWGDGEMTYAHLPIEEWFLKEDIDEILDLIDDIKRKDGPYRGKVFY